MTVPEIIQIIDLGGTLCFALLVWQELRGMRHESLALMREIKGFVDLKKTD
jgi:hypothetical protein